MRTLGFALDGKWQGVAAISDPIREDVPAAVERCQGAGITVKIVTGDTVATATEIGRQIGLFEDKANIPPHHTAPQHHYRSRVGGLERRRSLQARRRDKSDVEGKTYRQATPGRYVAEARRSGGRDR